MGLLGGSVLGAQLSDVRASQREKGGWAAPRGIRNFGESRNHVGDRGVNGPGSLRLGTRAPAPLPGVGK